jgi:seryl-tRNA synthetase
MATTNQELYEKLQKYLQLKKDLEEDIKNAEQWLKEADKEKDKTAIEVAQWNLERKQLFLEAVELAISEIATFLNERWAEIKEGDL